MRRRAFAFALCGILASCRNRASLARRVDDSAVERYRLKGVVVRLDALQKTATIEHGQIKNDSGKVWMEAMTMEFPVSKDWDFQLLKVGTTITAIVVSSTSGFEYWIEDVRVSE